MTEHRNLKKLVRERMARTGESYTTAHRHVTGSIAGSVTGTVTGARAAVAPPDGLLPGYPVPADASHRPSALARGLLAHAGTDVSEAMACGLGGGIGFLYAVFEYREVATPLLTIVAQHHPQPWLDAVAAHLGLTLTTTTSSRPGPALAKLDTVLDAGTPAQILVSRGDLPWHEPAHPEEGADPWAVVVAGSQDGTYLVDDGDGDLHRVDAAVLVAAWAAHRKGRFALTTVDRPTAPVAVAAGARAAMRTTYAHLTGPVLGHAFDANMGLSGMHRLAEDLADTRTKKGWVRRFGSPEALAVGADRLADCLTTAYTAPGATRPLYAAFLAEAADLTGLDLLPVSRTATEAGSRWSEVADVAAAVSPGDDPAEVVARLAGLVAEVVPIEERLAEGLGAALEEAVGAAEPSS